MQTQIQVIHPLRRSTTILEEIPALDVMQAIVGGHIEHVRVLRQDIDHRYEFTYMIVNEEGVLRDLERNSRATDLYLAYVRRRFPEASEPWREAQKEAEKRWSKLGVAVYADITPAQHQGKEPFIAGTAIHFAGYTCDELDEIWGE